MPTGFITRPSKPAKATIEGTRDNATSTSIEADPKEQMRLMDRLPAELKRLVWEAPVRLDLRQVQWARFRYKAGAEAFLVAAIMREYPGWKAGAL